jgi:hypothetical protein
MTPLDHALTLRAAIEECLERFGLIAVSGTKDERPGFVALGSLFESRDAKRQIVVTLTVEDTEPGRVRDWTTSAA